MYPIKVKLKDDLTKYGKGLIPGIEGQAIGAFGSWSRTYSTFITVRFDNGQTLDVLWKGLEIIDKEYLAEQAVIQSKLDKQIKKAKNIILKVGPRGGFKNLSFEFSDMDGNQKKYETYLKEEGLNLLKILENLGKKIKKEIVS